MGHAVVTGSASGIGAAVAAGLRKEGFDVIGIDLKGAEIEADLSSHDGRRDAIKAVIGASGGAIDRLVLCAGLGSHLEDLPLIASVNYFGAIELLDGLQGALKRGNEPAAVAISSNSARFGPFDDHPFVLACLEGDESRAREIIAGENGFIAYGGSKHALARALRRRSKTFGADGIRLNGIAPGPTETAMLQSTREHPIYSKGFDALEIPVGRYGTAEEIADFILLMMGPKAAFMHGSIVYLDGGNDAATFPDRF